MDILQKLRLVFWALVLALWGMFMYQFLRPELQRNYPNLTAAADAFLLRNDGLLRLMQGLPRALRPDLAKLTGQPQALAMLPDEGPELSASSATRRAASLPPQFQPRPKEESKPPILTSRLVTGTTGIVGIAPRDEEQAVEMAEGKAENSERAPENKNSSPAKTRRQWPKPPDGFATRQARYFLIYREKPEITDQFLDALEMLHSSLMLDLAPFSPWHGEERALLYFFSSQETYKDVTGRPYWSGGAASLELRIIYLLESRTLMGDTAHELSHLYFDSFFLPGQPPLWLSEGVALLMQANRAMSPPQWLGENLKRLAAGEGMPLERFMEVGHLGSSGFSEDQVRMWYAQAYSLSLFLTKLSGPDTFHAFCKNIRDGKPPAQSLLAAYGMPFNTLQALERAWRYDLKTGKITGILQD